MTNTNMFKITPPIRQNVVYLILLLFTCTLLSACTCCSKKANTEDEAQPVSVRKSLFHNRDSILYYADLAYNHEDPKGLFVMAVAAYLREDGTLPDSITTVSLDEAEIMLLRSAELGYPDAIQAIRCLSAHGMWDHSIPNEK